jgi:hypothetical protein
MFGNLGHLGRRFRRFQRFRTFRTFRSSPKLPITNFQITNSQDAPPSARCWRWVGKLAGGGAQWQCCGKLQIFGNLATY